VHAREPVAPLAPRTEPARARGAARGRQGDADVVRLNRVAGNRAVARVLARRELEEGLAASAAARQPWNWTTADRERSTEQWRQACVYNLEHLRSEEYVHIAERRDFYKWFYEATAARGYETRWALAAYIVAGGMAEMASVDWTEGVSPLTNELQGLTRIGNQVIFDDVLPKLRDLWRAGPVRGAAARRRDEQILAEEQHLIQNLYRGVSADTMRRFARMADMWYSRARLGHRMHMGGRVDAGPYNRGADVPTFHSLVPTGEIANAEDRWRYGMELAGRMSTLPAYGPLDAMPPVSAAYSSSERFDQLNVRPHLHMVDAMLNDTWFDEAAIVQQLRALSSREQRELTADSWRMRRLVGGLSFAELKRGIADLPDMPLAEKMWWLGRSLHVPSWETVGYDEVRPMIVLAARTHPEFLAAMQTDASRDVFLSICTDDTIHVAVADLRLTPALAADWIAHETSIF